MKDELRQEASIEVLDEDIDVTVEAQEELDTETEMAEIIMMDVEEDFDIEPDEEEVKNETAKFIALRKKKLAA